MESKINNMINKNLPSFSKNKMFYIILFTFIGLLMLNVRPVSQLNSNSLVFRINFVIIELYYLCFATLFYMLGIKLLKRNNVFYKIFSVLLFLLGIVFVVFPPAVYYEIVKIDSRIIVLQHKSDSLRKIGK
jgi:hypothetical protein